MSPSPGLDGATASWLSTLDPALALLPEAVGAMDGAQLHDARWTPGGGCRLSYRAPTTAGSARFVAVDVAADGWTRRDYRDDARLPGLARAADPSVVATLLAPVLGEPVACRVEPVRFRPGSRCVLRYDVTTRSGRTCLYAKVFRPERFCETASRARQLADAPTGRMLVPALIAAWPAVQALVGDEVAGRRVSALIGDPLVPLPERLGVAGRLGELLAGFHAVTDVAAPGWTAQDQLTSLVEGIGAVQRVDPRLTARLLRCLDVLQGSTSAPGSQVLSHGSFRASQVVRTAHDDLVALDTDRLALSAASRDLGTALAHLTWLCVRQPRLQPLADRIASAMLRGYRCRAGPVDPASLLWWRAVGLLQVAVRRFRRLEVGSWSAVPLVADAVEDLLAAGPRVRGGIVDHARMTHAAGSALGPLAQGPGPVRVRSARLLADAPGRRRVVRLEVDGLETGGPVALIGKVFDDLWRARLLYRHLHLLSEGPFREGALRVPTPVTLLPSERMVLYRAFEGLPLDHVCEPEPAVAGARTAARWLARLHRSDVRLPRTLSLEQEQASCRRWATLIGAALPVAGEPARNLAAGWATAVQRLAPAPASVPIHKDFHAGHVLLGDGICVLDLDEARAGDPAFDVAHFCTYLEAVARVVSRDLLRAAFLDEYAAATEGADPGRHAVYSAYTWLKIARQLAIGSGPFRDAAATDRERLVLSALTRGLTCLDR
jgi:aminoglycoside phosphotransferase (APT) family kinase protein